MLFSDSVQDRGSDAEKIVLFSMNGTDIDRACQKRGINKKEIKKRNAKEIEMLLIDAITAEISK